MQGYSYDKKERCEDQILWEEIISGDKNALGHLFDGYSKELLTYGFRISGDMALTKDAIQDVFVDVWLYRNNLSTQVQVKFYLYRCLRRSVLKQMSGRQASNAELTDFEPYMDSQSSAETEWVTSEIEMQQNNRILKSLSLLSAREKEIVSLKYFSDLKLREIALMLDLREQTVANTLQNALTKMRKHLVYFFLFLQYLF